MRTRAAVVTRLVVLVLLGAAVLGLAPVLPGVPDGAMAYTAATAAMLFSVQQLVLRGRWTQQWSTARTLQLAIAAAAGAYVLSLVAENVGPLAFVAGLLIGLGLGTAVALVMGPAEMPSVNRLAQARDRLPPVVFWSWLSLAVALVLLAAAASGGRVPDAAFAVGLVVAAVVAVGADAISRRARA